MPPLDEDLIDALACELYVDWCRDTSIGDEARARARFAAMPEFGRRPFVSLARVAERHLAPSAPASDATANRAALRASGRCSCGQLGILNGAGLCMACHSREAE